MKLNSKDAPEGYEAVPRLSVYCDGCAFEGLRTYSCSAPAPPSCISDLRKDRCDVKFIKLPVFPEDL